MKVCERKKVIAYIKKRQLEKPYLKAKNLIAQDHLELVNFKLRKPKSDKVYSFRITKKYRAYGHFVEDVFVVASISDHQD